MAIHSLSSGGNLIAAFLIARHPALRAREVCEVRQPASPSPSTREGACNGVGARDGERCSQDKCSAILGDATCGCRTRRNPCRCRSEHRSVERRKRDAAREGWSSHTPIRELTEIILPVGIVPGFIFAALDCFEDFADREAQCFVLGIGRRNAGCCCRIYFRCHWS